MSMPGTRNIASSSAFTLVELLVVMAIVSLLISVLLPALASARKTAQNLQCLNVVRQYGIANDQYATDFTDHHLPYRTYHRGNAWASAPRYATYWNFQLPRYGLEFRINTASPLTPATPGIMCPAETRAISSLTEEAAAHYTPVYETGLYDDTLNSGVGDWKFAPLKRLEVRSPTKVPLFIDWAEIYDDDQKGALMVYTDNGLERRMAFRHQGFTSNINFMDGHARSLSRANIQQELPGSHWSSTTLSLWVDPRVQY